MKQNPIVLSALLLLSLNVFSQIEGDVRSKDDKRISKALVIAMDTTKNIVDSVRTAEDGFYSFTRLKPGTYRIEARAAGFENKIYPNVISREKLLDPSAGRDKSNATRLQIVLVPAKPSKQ